MNESAIPGSFTDPDGDELPLVVVEYSSEKLFAIDASGTVIFANPTVQDILGYPPSELVGRQLSTLVSERSLPYHITLEVVYEGTTDLNTVEVPVIHADGDEHRVPISMQCHEDGQRSAGGNVGDISERRRNEKMLYRYQRILETIDDGIYILDSNFSILHVNQAMASMVGYSREELVGSHSSLLVSDDVLEEATKLSLELLENRDESATLTTELTTADGDQIPIETRFSIYPFDDESYGHVGVVRDITERKEFEEMLTALHDSTRGLLGVETRSDVCEVVADAATDVIGLSAAVVYLFDRDENALQPIELSGDVADDASSLPVIDPDDDIAWRAFVEDESTVLDGSDCWDWMSDGYLVIPLGEHGLFVVSPTEPGTFDDDTRTLVGVLAASAEAGLSQVERERALQERDQTLQRQNRRLRQLDRVNTIIREIDQTLVQADTLDDIRNEVCDRLVASDRFAFAWIGEVDGYSGELHPQAWAGDGHGYLDEVSLTIEDDSTEPALRTAVTREPTVVQNVAANFRAEPWRQVALSWDFCSAVAVPLIYGDYLYGILAVYANRRTVVDDTVEAVAELGETIANAMDTVETKQALLTDRHIELELSFSRPEDPLFRLAREANCSVRLNRLIPQSDGASRIFFTATGAEPERVRTVAENSFAIDNIRLVAERNDSSLFEVADSESTVAETLVESGAHVRSLTTDDDELYVIVEFPKERTVREFVETVRKQYSDVELAGRRDIERPKQTSLEYRSEFKERLTDRQLEVLQVAYHSGFFEWPRETTGQEIAESLGVSQPTVNRHLRACERKLFTMLLENE